MSRNENERQVIFLYLKSLNFHFLDSWVVECINYYKSANPGISLEVLKNEVKQQWLLVNLRELKVRSLPPDLKSKNKIILNGAYAVQVEKMIDASQSCYSQLQKVLNVDVEDIETTTQYKEQNFKTPRCLVFDICDGVQELQAMEYQPINKIKTNDPELLPGFKMVIIGPVECREGMILLKNENVRVCGGEVDTLAVSNCLKNILIKKLNLNESDYPDNVPLNSLCEIKSEIKSETRSKTPQFSSQEPIIANKLADGSVDSFLSQNNDLFLSIPLETEILAQETQSKESLKSSKEFFGENDFFDQNLSFWNEDEFNQDNQAISSSKKHSLSEEDLLTSKNKRRSLDPELEKDTLTISSIGNFKTQNSIHSNVKDIFKENFDELNSAISVNNTINKNSVQPKLSFFFSNKNSGSASSSLDNIEPDRVSGTPFVYLKNIISARLCKPTVFTIKAVILTLKKKITIENNNFNLKASITDGSSSIDVEFCSDVLEDLLGFSPCEMVVMMKAKHTNSATALKLKEIFSKAQEKLISLNCLMDIKFFPDGKSPVVLSFKEVNISHLEALKKRN